MGKQIAGHDKWGQQRKEISLLPNTPILLTTRDRISIGKGSLMDISTFFQVALIEFDRIVMGGDS